MLKWLVGIALACLIFQAEAQSLKKIIKGVVDDALTTKVAEVATGANIDPREDDDQNKMYWDNPAFTPFTLDGYRLFRKGSSGHSKYSGGVIGWHNCDGSVLVGQLTKMPLTVEDKKKCTDQEYWLQQKAGEAGHEHPKGWPMWKDYVDQRSLDFSSLPLRLYYRFDISSIKEERPDGIIFHFGSPNGLLGTPGFGDGTRYDISIKGTDVVTEWDQWIGSSQSSSVHKRLDAGHARVKVSLTKQQRDEILRGKRNPAWDTVFYTIHSVRKVAPIRGDRPHYEVSLTIDKVVLGMDEGFRTPVNQIAF